MGFKVLGFRGLGLGSLRSVRFGVSGLVFRV